MDDSDRRLLERCRAGDQTAWQELVDRHTRRVFHTVYRFVGRGDQAEDLTQDVFVKVYQSLDRYRSDEGAFSTWIGTVARNHAIDHYRRRREERVRRAEDPRILEMTPSTEEAPVRGLEREERVQIVHRGLRALPRDLREPIVLCDLQGVSYEDAAAALRVPVGTVKSRLNRGRLELAKRLRAHRRELAGC